MSENNSIFEVKNIEFSVYFNFGGFWICLFKILDAACDHNVMSHSLQL